ncbi:hypothetical protein [Flavihumibacter profundi]|uniref:hypothetical protein n=1 Tax=Flavihumibacter profundi TaxID=2716883 RepID=UPI001CC43549|nr:hypothetical protein [Flavihumibacter profundi]MBZ5857319.1 hypothetical protein [Flavihumibacter profundi]
MTLLNTIFGVIIVVFLGCNNETSNVSYSKSSGLFKENNQYVDTFRFTYVNSHSNAQKLMKEPYLFSEIDETAPFGNDEGSDAAYGFRKWRSSNLKISTNIYLNDLRSSWGYSFFDSKEMDSNAIMKYLNTPSLKNDVEVDQQINALKESLKNSVDTSFKSMDDKQFREIVVKTSDQIGSAHLIGLDNSIIGIGFAQFVMEGKIDADFKSLVEIAIKRQLLPVLLSRWDKDYVEVRKRELIQMLEIIQKAPSH